MAYPTKITIDGKDYPVKRDSNGSYIEYKNPNKYLITSREFYAMYSGFYRKTDFSNRVFVDEVNLTDFAAGINFSNSIFIAEVDFTNAQFHYEANFSNVQFQDKANFSSANFTNEANFDKAEFQNIANFPNAKFTKQAIFGRAKFHNEANFHDANFHDYAHFAFAKLQGVIFEKTKFNEAMFSNAVFQKQAFFYKAEFQKHAYFHDAKFHDELNFNGAEFHDIADFPFVEFHDKTQFNDAEFHDEANFNGDEFYDEAHFYNAKFHDEANFNGAEFYDITYFDYAMFNESFDLTFVNTAKENKKIKPLQLSLEKTNVKEIFYSGTKIAGETRETCNILKNVALKKNDQITALDFHTQEYNKHYDELKWQENFLNKSLLTIEKYCSKFGTNWLFPMGWLLFFNFLFSLITECKEVYISLQVISCPQEFLPEFLAEFFQNLWLIPYSKDILEGASWGYLSLFTLYKVLSIFLLYEIIKSFRKYSRKI